MPCQPADGRTFELCSRRPTIWDGSPTSLCKPNGIEPLPRIPTCATARAARADSQRFDPVTHRLLLVLYITPSLPSSQTALSLLHAKGESRVAARLSQLYVPQYLLSIATIAANVAVAVNLIGDAPLPLASSNQSGVQ